MWLPTNSRPNDPSVLFEKALERIAAEASPSSLPVETWQRAGYKMVAIAATALITIATSSWSLPNRRAPHVIGHPGMESADIGSHGSASRNSNGSKNRRVPGPNLRESGGPPARGEYVVQKPEGSAAPGKTGYRSVYEKTVANPGRAPLENSNEPKVRQGPGRKPEASESIASLEAAILPKVHVRIACDSSAISQGKLMAMLFSSQLDAKQLDLQLLTGEDVSRDTVLGFLDRITNVRAEDAIVFYYSGHAARDASVGEQFFQIGRGEGMEHVLRREEIRDRLQAKGARNVVLITEFCGPPTTKAHKGMVLTARGADNPVIGTSPLFRYLFFEHRGILDLTLSSPKEISEYSNDGQGSTFTYAFLDVLGRHAGEPISWRDLLREVETAAFRSLKAENLTGGDAGDRSQYSQYLRIIGLNRGPVFGARLQLQGGDGLVVTEVVEGSPAWRQPASLRFGDAVLRINDRPLETLADFAMAVDSSPKRMSLTVRRRGGTIETVVVSLDGD